ncbi:glycosyltransferase family 4 protein [Vibrio vulnificus]|uniref:glycosyltransferase family 4 protein n=1 Tax=Vibrio vulnificus TaxID=672 RepID=UPI0010330428|nr:glycosyltransferase family 4 protein [Vibrio vulnificus]QBH28373.1 Glycosyltransferase [Vibrio vulnificus]
MKKILVFSHEWPPFIGGVGTVGYQIAKWYANLGHHVEVVTRKQDSVSRIENVRFHIVDTLPYFWFLSYKKYFRNNIKLSDFDVILLNECAPAIASTGIFSDEDYNKSHVIIHGLEIENIYRSSVSNWLRKLFLFKYRHEKCCKKSKSLLFVSNFMKNKFIKNTDDNFESKSKVFYAGVDTKVFFNIDSKHSRDRISVVSASRITEMKGYKDLFFAMEQSMNANANIYWSICGDGDFLPKLKLLVERSGISNRITFHGPCDRNQLNKIYSENDIYVLLSKYDEALPLSYVEAQLSGLYSIGFNKGGVIETIQHEKTGSLINSEDELVELFAKIVSGEKRLPSRRSIAKNALVFDMDVTMKELSELTQ